MTHTGLSRLGEGGTRCSAVGSPASTPAHGASRGRLELKGMISASVFVNAASPNRFGGFVLRWASRGVAPWATTAFIREIGHRPQEQNAMRFDRHAAFRKYTTMFAFSVLVFFCIKPSAAAPLSISLLHPPKTSQFAFFHLAQTSTTITDDPALQRCILSCIDDNLTRDLCFQRCRIR